MVIIIAFVVAITFFFIQQDNYMLLTWVQATYRLTYLHRLLRLLYTNYLDYFTQATYTQSTYLTPSNVVWPSTYPFYSSPSEMLIYIFLSLHFSLLCSERNQQITRMQFERMKGKKIEHKMKKKMMRIAYDMFHMLLAVDFLDGCKKIFMGIMMNNGVDNNNNNNKINSGMIAILIIGADIY